MGYNPAETPDTYESSYDGGAVSNFLHLLVVILFSSLTLFLAMPALVCWYFRWETSHVRINGRQLEFDGKGMVLFDDHHDRNILHFQNAAKPAALAH